MEVRQGWHTVCDGKVVALESDIARPGRSALDKWQVELKRVPKDGDCQFHVAASYFPLASGMTAVRVRAAVCAHLWAYVASGVKRVEYEAVDAGFVERMSKGGEFGDVHTLWAMSEVFGWNVYVMYLSSAEDEVQERAPYCVSEYKPSRPNKLFVYDVDGVHYHGDALSAFEGSPFRAMLPDPHVLTVSTIYIAAGDFLL